MSKNVINMPRRIKPFRLHPPLPPKQELTLELAWELKHAPGIADMLWWFAQEYPDEFYASVAKHCPEMFALWAIQAMRDFPDLRRKLVREMQRDGVELNPLASRIVWRAWR